MGMGGRTGKPERTDIYGINVDSKVRLALDFPNDPMKQQAYLILTQVSLNSSRLGVELRIPISTEKYGHLLSLSARGELTAQGDLEIFINSSQSSPLCKQSKIEKSSPGHEDAFYLDQQTGIYHPDGH